MRLEPETIDIRDVYVPTKRRRTLEPEKAQKLAEDILENGQAQPILVRWDGKRFVLVEGLHRLEACRSLGEQTIAGLRVKVRMK